MRRRASPRCSSGSASARSTRSWSGTASRSSASATARSSSRRGTGSLSPVRSPADRRLYLVTRGRPDVCELVEAAVRGGVDFVQVREKELPDAVLLPLLADVRELTRRLAVPLVVNDRADLALLAEADYVHVGQE